MSSLWLLLACAGDKDDTGVVGVKAIFDPARAEHYFDVPFPSDDLRDADGFPDLTGFPTAPQPLAAGIVGGWATRATMTTQGFANNGAAYFRFEGPLSLPTETAGTSDDPVLLISLDTAALVPLTLRFIADPAGDPFYAENTLALAPTLGHPPESGGRYAAVVMASAGAAAPDGWSPPAEVTDALARAGVDGAPAIATVFTVQDAVGQLQALIADIDARSFDDSAVVWRQVRTLSFESTTSPSGYDATLQTVTYTDGTSEQTYLGALDDPEDANHSIDLENDWPMVVYEADLPFYNYSGLEDRPYMSAGLGHLNDVSRYSGWIQFSGGQLVSEPEIEWVRVTLSIPRGSDGGPVTDAEVLIWDHGTAGNAYNAVQNRNVNDEGRALAELLADHNLAIVGRDAALYGQRYPLIDEGYGDTLGFYNIVNLPAFRDNQRQTAIEGYQLLRLLRETDTLPAALDLSNVRRGGHSMGSVTSNLGVAAAPDTFKSVFLVGSGGVFAHFFLDTGMLADLDPTLISSLFALVGQDVPDEVTPEIALAAILGLPESSWGNIDRLHPVITLFQWLMDPSDPMAVAPAEELPAWMVVCTDDRQVPNFTSFALLEALPDPTFEEWPATADYDPHQCLTREDGPQAFYGRWMEETR